MKVLIIDDDAMTRQIIVRAVESMGLITIQSGNGKHGWETLFENPDIRMIVTDIRMPDMDGIELVQLVRCTESSAEIPVIVVSGAVGEDEVQPLLEMGNCSFCPKPINVGKLKGEVKRLLQGVRKIDQ